MRVLICGNSSWPDMKCIAGIMQSYKEAVKEGLVFISGMARGADWIAYCLAAALNVSCDAYPANEDGRAHAAEAQGKTEDEVGRNRNQWMLDSGVDVCHAFAYDLPKNSYGTRDMVNRCVGAGVVTFWHDGKSVYAITEEVDEDTKREDLEVVA